MHDSFLLSPSEHQSHLYLKNEFPRFKDTLLVISGCTVADSRINMSRCHNIAQLIHTAVRPFNEIICIIANPVTEDTAICDIIENALMTHAENCIWAQQIRSMTYAEAKKYVFESKRTGGKFGAGDYNISMQLDLQHIGDEDAFKAFGIQCRDHTYSATDLLDRERMLHRDVSKVLEGLSNGRPHSDTTESTQTPYTSMYALQSMLDRNGDAMDLNSAQLDLFPKRYSHSTGFLFNAMPIYNPIMHNAIDAGFIHGKGHHRFFGANYLAHYCIIVQGAGGEYIYNPEGSPHYEEVMEPYENAVDVLARNPCFTNPTTNTTLWGAFGTTVQVIYRGYLPHIYNTHDAWFEVTHIVGMVQETPFRKIWPEVKLTRVADTKKKTDDFWTRYHKF